MQEAIKSRKEAEIEDQYIEDCLAKASENMKIDINEEILDDEVHRMIHQFEEQLKMQGLNLEQYFGFTKMIHKNCMNKWNQQAHEESKNIVIWS